MLAPLGVRQADGLLRARHGVDLLAGEEIQGRIYSIQVPARAPVGSQDEELAQGDVMALADEPTWRLPASGWAIFHQEGFHWLFGSGPAHSNDFNHV